MQHIYCINVLNDGLRVGARVHFEVSTRDGSGGTERPNAKIVHTHHSRLFLKKRLCKEDISSNSKNFYNSSRDAHGPVGWLKIVKIWPAGNCLATILKLRVFCSMYFIYQVYEIYTKLIVKHHTAFL